MDPEKSDFKLGDLCNNWTKAALEKTIQWEGQWKHWIQNLKSEILAVVFQKLDS